MDSNDRDALIARVKAMSEEKRAKIIEDQRKSFIRSIMEWPRPKFRWINGVKVYDSYKDYCND